MSKLIQFENRDCRQTHRLLDDFLAGELSVESSQDILHHLDRCAFCRQERDFRLELRQQLRDEWESQPVPAGLRRSVEGRLFEKRRFFAWNRLAAGLLLAVATGLMAWLWLSPGQQQLDHRTLALADHLDCVGSPPPPGLPLPLDAVMWGEPDGLPTVVEGYRLAEINQCKIGEIEFIHYVFSGPSMVSVIFEAKRERVVFRPGDSRVHKIEEIEFFLSTVEGVRIAVVDAPGHFVYFLGGAEPVDRFTRQLGPWLKSALLSSSAAGPLLLFPRALSGPPATPVHPASLRPSSG